MENSIQPAFPPSKEMCEASEITEYPYGLTKREYFAAKAMQGLLTRVHNRPNNETDLGVLESERIAYESTIMADRLIEALNIVK